MIQFRKHLEVHRYIVLSFILIFSLIAQWSRWLPVYLSTVRLDVCAPNICRGLSFVPLCKGCDANDSACESCNACRTEHESWKYNFQDGVCMTSKQYGLMTGFGFSLTFSIFGLVAGYFVDITSERGSTILGLSVLFAAIVSILYSYCDNFQQVLVLRACLGGLQAFGAPASVQMITSHFKRPADRPMANAAYTIGLYIGAGFSSLSTIIAERFGWRVPFLIVGGLGIVAAFLFELIVDVRCTLCSPTDEYNLLRAAVGGDSMVESDHPRSHVGALDPTTKTERTPLLSPILQQQHDRDDKDDINMRPEQHGNTGDPPSLYVLSAGEVGYNGGGGAVDGHESLACGTRRLRSSSLHTAVSSLDPTVNTPPPRPCCVILYTLVCGDKITGAMPLLLMACSIRFVAGIATFIYYPVLVARRFPDFETHFSVFNAVVVLSCGSFSSFVGGKFGQYVVKKDGLEGLAKFIASTCLFCAPLFALAFRTTHFWTSVTLLALEYLNNFSPLDYSPIQGYLIGEAWMGASMALLQGLSPASGQGLAMSFYLFLNWNSAALITDTIGYMDPGTEDLSRLLVIFTATPLAISLFLFTALAAVLHFAKKQTSSHVVPLHLSLHTNSQSEQDYDSTIRTKMKNTNGNQQSILDQKSYQQYQDLTAAVGISSITSGDTTGTTTTIDRRHYNPPSMSFTYR